MDESHHFSQLFPFSPELQLKDRMVLYKGCTAEKALDHGPENSDSNISSRKPQTGCFKVALPPSGNLGFLNYKMKWWVTDFSSSPQCKYSRIFSLSMRHREELPAERFNPTNKNVGLWIPGVLENAALAVMQGGAALEGSSCSLPAMMLETMSDPATCSLHPSRSQNSHITQ